MEEIAGYNWPGDFSADLPQLEKLIGKYKLKDAKPLLESMIQRLKTR